MPRMSFTSSAVSLFFPAASDHCTCAATSSSKPQARPWNALMHASCIWSILASKLARHACMVTMMTTMMMMVVTMMMMMMMLMNDYCLLYTSDAADE